jgi:hypothetical protein
LIDGRLGRSLLPPGVMLDAKRFVYIIQSIGRPAAYYVATFCYPRVAWVRGRHSSVGHAYDDR